MSFLSITFDCTISADTLAYTLRAYPVSVFLRRHARSLARLIYEGADAGGIGADLRQLNPKSRHCLDDVDNRGGYRPAAAFY